MRRALLRAQSELRTGSAPTCLGCGLGSGRSAKDPLPVGVEKTGGSAAREVVRVSTYGQFPADWAEIRRPDGTRDLIRTLLRPLPRNGGKARLLICPYCKIPRRGLYGWGLGGHYTSSVMRSTWGCRKCNLLRYASEGGALLIRPRGTLGFVFETGHSPRPESWLPYVFTSTEECGAVVRALVQKERFDSFRILFRG